MQTMSPNLRHTLKPRASVLALLYAVVIALLALFSAAALWSYFASVKEARTDLSLWLFAVAGACAILLLTIWIHLDLRSATYTITAREAEIRWGIFVKASDCVQLAAVRSIKVRQNLLQRLFGLGDVILYTTSNTPLVLRELPQPEAQKEMIWELVRQAAAQTPALTER